VALSPKWVHRLSKKIDVTVKSGGFNLLSRNLQFSQSHVSGPELGRARNPLEKSRNLSALCCLQRLLFAYKHEQLMS